jgi:hypothetical protein
MNNRVDESRGGLNGIVGQEPVSQASKPTGFWYDDFVRSAFSGRHSCQVHRGPATAADLTLPTNREIRNSAGDQKLNFAPIFRYRAGSHVAGARKVEAK